MADPFEGTYPDDYERHKHNPEAAKVWDLGQAPAQVESGIQEGKDEVLDIIK